MTAVHTPAHATEDQNEKRQSTQRVVAPVNHGWTGGLELCCEDQDMEGVYRTTATGHGQVRRKSAQQFDEVMLRMQGA